jgi:hypothetical protein
MTEEKIKTNKAGEDQQEQNSPASDFEQNNNQKNVDDGWVEQADGQVIKLKVGESIEGTLISIDQSSRYNSGIYKIKTKDSDIPKVLLGTTMLDRKLKIIELGTQVKIKRDKDAATDKGQPMHIYHVYTRKE